MLLDEEVALAIKQDAIQVAWETGTWHPFRSGQGEEAPIFIDDFQGVYRGAALEIAPDGEIADMPLDRDSWLALLHWRHTETLTNSGIDFLSRHRFDSSLAPEKNALQARIIMQIAIKGVKKKMHIGIFLLSIHPEDLRKCPAVTTGSLAKPR